MPSGVYIRTKEHRKKLSKSNAHYWKNKHFSVEHKKKLSNSKKEKYCGKNNPFYGKKHSEKTKEKISKANTGYKHTAEAKKKISLKHTGKKVTVETRKKLSESQKGVKNSMYGRLGKDNPKYGVPTSDIQKKQLRDAWVGHKHTTESKKKMSEARKGEKHYNWLGGKSFEPYGIAFNKELKEQIKIRDNYRCQECFKHESEFFTKAGTPRKLCIHHIDYNKKNNGLNNLISLCLSCHMKTNFNREKWTYYFLEYNKNLMEENVCIRN